MQRGTIHDSWEAYRSLRFLKKTSPTTEYMCQLAFYEGATAILGEILRLTDGAFSKEEIKQKAHAFLDEVINFKILTLPKGPNL